MSIRVHIPTPLRQHTGGQDSVEANGKTVQEVLDDVGRQYAAISERLFDSGQIRRFVNVYLNDEDIRYLDNLQTPVKDGDEVSIIPAVAGGAVPSVRVVRRALTQRSIEVSAWSNGDGTEGGYGLRLRPADRDALVNRRLPHVVLDLPGVEPGIRVGLSASFWGTCPELRSKSIGQWLMATNQAPWPARRPPRFRLVPVGGNRFRVL